MTEFDNVIDALLDLSEDTGVPKNVLKKIDTLVDMMEKSNDSSITINKVLSDLDDLANDTTIPQHIRTQLWHVSSLLETI